MAAERTPATGRRWLVVALTVAVLGLFAGCSLGSGLTTPTSDSSSSNPETIAPVPSNVSTTRPESTSPTPRRADSGIRVNARVNEKDGTFEVTEVVRLDDPISSLTLRPPDLRELPGDLGRAKPVARDLQVTAGGRTVKVAKDEVRALTSLALPEPVRRIELRYRLTGVSHRSEPSTAGRALAAIGPLIAGVPDDLPVAMAVPGPTVRNLQCPAAEEQSCAVGPPGHMRIAHPLPWNASIVVVQLDMV
jgi:hypothetical protein